MRETAGTHAHAPARRPTYVGLQKKLQQGTVSTVAARQPAATPPIDHGWLWLRGKVDQGRALPEPGRFLKLVDWIPSLGTLPRTIGQLEQLQNLATDRIDPDVVAPSASIVEAVRMHLSVFAAAAPFASVADLQPWIAASADGSIGVDWRYNGRRAAVTFDRNGDIDFYATGDGSDATGSLRSALDAFQLAEWLLKGTALTPIADE